MARETLESLVAQLMGSDVPSLGLQQWMTASDVHPLGSVVPGENAEKAKSGSQTSIKTGRHQGFRDVLLPLLSLGSWMELGI